MVKDAAWALQGTIIHPVRKLHFSVSSNNNHKASHAAIEVVYMRLSIKVYYRDVAGIVVSVSCLPDFKKNKITCSIMAAANQKYIHAYKL